MVYWYSRLPSVLGRESRCSPSAPPCFLCPLPFPHSAAGSGSVPTLGLKSYPMPEPVQAVAGRVSQTKGLTQGLPFCLGYLGCLFISVNNPGPHPDLMETHAIPPLGFCLGHCLLLCSLSQMGTLMAPLSSTLSSSLFPDWTDPGSSWPAALSLLAVPAPLTRHSIDCQLFYCNQDCCSLGQWAPAAYSNSALGAGPRTSKFTCGFDLDPS